MPAYDIARLWSAPAIVASLVLSLTTFVVPRPPNQRPKSRQPSERGTFDTGGAVAVVAEWERRNAKELRMCLGEYGTVVELIDDAHAVAQFADGTLRTVSLAVLAVEGVTVERGDTVAVSIGMALHLVDHEEDFR